MIDQFHQKTIVINYALKKINFSRKGNFKFS